MGQSEKSICSNSVYFLLVMEWLLIALSSLLTALTPVGLVVDQTVADNIRRRVSGVEDLAVRVDNTPSWQLIQGQVQRVRLASRGLEPIPSLRIERFDLETDPIALKLDQLSTNNLQKFRASLGKPLQGAIQVVMTEKDINQALANPQFKTQLQAWLKTVLPAEAPPLELKTATLQFGQNNTLSIQVELLQAGEAGQPPESLAIAVNTGFQVEQGHTLKLIEPSASLNGRKISNRIVSSVVGSFSDRLSLKSLEKQGVIARLLALQTEPGQLSLAAFLRLNPLDSDLKPDAKN